MALESFDILVPAHLTQEPRAEEYMSFLHTHGQNCGTNFVPGSAGTASSFIRIWGLAHVDEGSDRAREYLSRLAGEMAEVVRLRKRIAWRKANQLEDMEESSGLSLDIPEEW